MTFFVNTFYFMNFSIQYELKHCILFIYNDKHIMYELVLLYDIEFIVSLTTQNFSCTKFFGIVSILVQKFFFYCKTATGDIVF